MRVIRSVIVFAGLTLASLTMAAQQAVQPGTSQNVPGFDQEAVDRGRDLLVAQCGFCHGSNARGGQSGPDLTRSALVQDDEAGRQLGAFLQAGRPDQGMPKFDFTDTQVSDLASFLHATIYLASNRRLYQILDILTGDPKAGEAFFNGAGRCTSCHSATGDLKGVGAKYDPAMLQNRFVMPRGGRGATPDPPRPAYLDKNAVQLTVTLPSGESFSGALVRVTDFDVTLYDPKTEQTRSWLRNGDVPKVVVTDPLQAHVDMWTKWTDADMHNMTAYLASLK
jgi:cytochrome c oxidase cbb3-type subunit III